MTVVPPAEAAKRADWIQILTPDETMGDFFEAAIKPALKPGQNSRLLPRFQHSLQDDCASRRCGCGDGGAQRSRAPGAPRYTSEGRGVPSLLAIHQDASGKAQDYGWLTPTALARRAPESSQTSFREETESDLFGEQSVLCGGLTSLMKKGFETLVEAGYAPEIAYFECIHEVKLIVDLIYEGGLSPHALFDLATRPSMAT